MHGPTWIFWANLTAFSLQTCGGLYMAGAGSCDSEATDALQVGLYPVVTMQYSLMARRTTRFPILY
jgi:hypothetical protein